MVIWIQYIKYSIPLQLVILGFFPYLNSKLNKAYQTVLYALKQTMQADQHIFLLITTVKMFPMMWNFNPI